MSRAGAVREAIRHIGGEVTLLRANEAIIFTASIQPSFAKAQDHSAPEGYYAPVGYALYAPADAPPLAAGDTIISSHSRYTVTQAEAAYLFGEPLYRHALLREEEANI